MHSILAAFVAVALAAPALSAQVTTVDEGSFSILRNGQRIGREEFTIRRTPGAEGQPVLVASATVAYDQRRIAPALRTDSSGAPIAYALEVRTGTEVQEQLKGAVGRGRFSAVSRTPKGESAREYIVTDGALILDDEIFHQYFFVARAARTGTLPVVVPRRGAQVMMRIEDGGAATVTVGGRALPARRVTMREPAGGRRDILVDAQGRVLQVELPALGIVATRDDPPR
jgi:outer membrane protein assembly factor BamB